MAEIIKIDFDCPDLALKSAFNILKNGGLVSFPTETFYGLAANALDEKAINKVFSAKFRNTNKPLLVFIGSEELLYKLTKEVNPTAKKLIGRFWPGPLTLVFKASSKFPKILTGNTGKIGIRISGSRFIRELCKISSFPITGTSANISDKPAPVTAEEVFKNLGDRIDLILDGGKTSGKQSSTVLDISGTEPILLRPGVIGKDLIEKTLGICIK